MTRTRTTPIALCMGRPFLHDLMRNLEAKLGGFLQNWGHPCARPGTCRVLLSQHRSEGQERGQVQHITAAVMRRIRAWRPSGVVHRPFFSFSPFFLKKKCEAPFADTASRLYPDVTCLSAYTVSCTGRGVSQDGAVSHNDARMWRKVAATAEPSVDVTTQRFAAKAFRKEQKT